MRLDHLLSKELIVLCPQLRVCPRMVVGWWLSRRTNGCRLFDKNCPGGHTPAAMGWLLFCGVRVVVFGLQAKCVLVRCWVSGAARMCFVPCGFHVLHACVFCACVVCGGVLCENCRVDASIFLFIFCLCFGVLYLFLSVMVVCYGRMVDALAC